MPVYGDSLKEWADHLREFLPRGQRDWSLEVAVHLGLALGSLERLQAAGIKTTEGNHRLVEEALDVAWRELLHIRLRNIPPEDLLKDVPRFYTLNRTGRIINGTDQTGIPTDARYYRNPNRRPEGNPIPKSRSRCSRRGRSRTG